MASKSASLSLGQRALLIIGAAAVYAIGFWPSRKLASYGLNWLGNPPYAGFKGLFLPHLLFYSTLTAIAAAGLWFAFVRSGMLPAPQLGRPTGRQIGAGVIGGLVALIVTLAVVYFLLPPGTLHWIDPVPWKIAGNLFSNFYEEFIYRGFMLVALAEAIGFWPAALVASAMWAMTHTQYPLLLQLLIFATGVFWSWVAREARSLWAPYASHMVLDIVGDSLIG